MRQVSLAITEKTTQATQLLNYTKMENSHFKCLNKYYIQTNETLVSITLVSTIPLSVTHVLPGGLHVSAD